MSKSARCNQSRFIPLPLFVIPHLIGNSSHARNVRQDFRISPSLPRRGLGGGLPIKFSARQMSTSARCNQSRVIPLPLFVIPDLIGNPSLARNVRQDFRISPSLPRRGLGGGLPIKFSARQMSTSARCNQSRVIPLPLFVIPLPLFVIPDLIGNPSLARNVRKDFRRSPSLLRRGLGGGLPIKYAQKHWRFALNRLYLQHV